MLATAEPARAGAACTCPAAAPRNLAGHGDKLGKPAVAATVCAAGGGG